ncbi:hypothetical protein COW97_02055 [Candidatus Roizmanbacteria bacterium CG22_combo_CG10-13_8_21_14_all_34_12]|uniref:Peptidase M48 domain-containing protein n=1 Tax=Candidatus Roizmanbacteria bacterium CG22_combo_CG10-13_8_21_14_all_34_12 TaxID=1974860 RepID=A0A2H0C0S2_9BACT|nr:MAG: hypothetical protein COW97_02055 [Candidatus Roizmanbacteria bacterium CG22_combo_CG10-13_8_21_14_all_34_12]
MAEVKKQQEKKPSFRNKAIILLSIAALGLLSASSPSISIATPTATATQEPITIVEPIILPASSITTYTVNSIDETIYDPTIDSETFPFVTVKTTPLKITVTDNQLVHAEKLPLPCGPGQKPADPESSNLPFPKGEEIDERAELCNKVSHIATGFGITLSSEQIEEIASEMIIVSKNDIRIFCGEGAAACFFNAPLIMFGSLPQTSQIAHELGHKAIGNANNTNYLSEATGICYFSKDGFRIIYSDQESITDYFVFDIPNEFFPSVFQQMLISRGGPKYGIMPEYLYSDEKKREDPSLIDEFQQLGSTYSSNPSIVDFNFLFGQKPTTTDTFFILLEELADGKIDIPSLVERFRAHIATLKIFENTKFPPRQPSELSPAEACK